MWFLVASALAFPHAVLDRGTVLRAGFASDAPSVTLDAPRFVEVVTEDPEGLVVRAPSGRGCVPELASVPGVEWHVDAGAALPVLAEPRRFEGPAGSVTLAVGTPLRVEGAYLVTVDQGVEVRIASGTVATRTYAAPPRAPRVVGPEVRLAGGDLLVLADARVHAPAAARVNGDAARFESGACVQVTLATPAATTPAPESVGRVGGFGAVEESVPEVFVRAGAPLRWEDGTPAGRAPEDDTWRVADEHAWCRPALTEREAPTPRVCVASGEDVVWLGPVTRRTEQEVTLERTPLTALPADVECLVILVAAPDGRVLLAPPLSCQRGRKWIRWNEIDPAWLEGILAWRVAPHPGLAPYAKRVQVSVSGRDAGAR